MDKEAALKAIGDLVQYLEFSGAAPKQAAKLRKALAALEEKPLAVVEGWVLNEGITSKKLVGLEGCAVWVYGDFYGKVPVTVTVTERHG